MPTEQIPNDDAPDVDLELEPIEPVEDDPVPELGDEEPAPKIVSAEDGIAELKAAREARAKAEEEVRTARTAQRQAEERAAQSSREVGNHQVQVAAGNIQQITSARGEVNQHIALLERDWEEAARNGDYAAQRKANSELTKYQATLINLDRGLEEWKAYKVNLERQVQQRATAPKPAEPETPKAAANTFDGWVETLSKPSREWINANRQHLNTDNKLKKLSAADIDADAEGLARDTPEYFAHIEKFMGLKTAPAAATTATRKVQTAAPTSRQSPTTQNTSQTVNLSPEQRRAARDMNMSDKEYAANRLRLIRQGRITA